MKRNGTPATKSTGEQGTAQERTTVLLKQLEAGVAAIQTSDDFQRVLAIAAKFHSYSFNNVLLIMAQRPNATRVAGYKTWQSLGRQVRKGERAIYILAPRPYRVVSENTTTGEAEIEREGITFRTVAVFDIIQTEGAELPTFEVTPLTGNAGQDVYDSLVLFAAVKGVHVTNQDTNVSTPDQPANYHGYYRPRTQVIFVKPAAPAQMMKTLIHELAHYLDEDLLTRPRDERETVAEATAYLVAAHAGIDTSTYSLPYIAGWAGRSDGAVMIKSVMERVQRIAHTLITSLDEQGQPTTEADVVQFVEKQRAA